VRIAHRHLNVLSAEEFLDRSKRDPRADELGKQRSGEGHASDSSNPGACAVAAQRLESRWACSGPPLELRNTIPSSRRPSRSASQTSSLRGIVRIRLFFGAATWRPTRDRRTVTVRRSLSTSPHFKPDQFAESHSCPKGDQDHRMPERFVDNLKKPTSLFGVRKSNERAEP